jgi:hypothetical protein
MKSSRRFFQKKNAKTAGARNDSAGAAGTGLTRCCRGAVRCRAKLRARLADLGDTPLALSPAEFGKLIADETEKWGKVMRAANIKLD